MTSASSNLHTGAQALIGITERPNCVSDPQIVKANQRVEHASLEHASPQQATRGAPHDELVTSVSRRRHPRTHRTVMIPELDV